MLIFEKNILCHEILKLAVFFQETLVAGFFTEKLVAAYIKTDIYYDDGYDN